MVQLLQQNAVSGSAEHADQRSKVQLFSAFGASAFNVDEIVVLKTSTHIISKIYRKHPSAFLHGFESEEHIYNDAEMLLCDRSVCWVQKMVCIVQKLKLLFDAGTDVSERGTLRVGLSNYHNGYCCGVL